MRGHTWVVLFLLPFTAAAAQEPAPPAPVPPEARPDRCRLAGQVVSAATNQPLRKVSLLLRAEGGRSSYGSTTDAAGRFAFEDVEPGTYRLIAERTGYLRQQYGARSRAGAPLALAPGQEINDLVFKLTPQSVITGKILDEDGEPITGAAVTVLRRSWSGGRRRLVPVGGSPVNDIGEFRAANLRPGRYFLFANVHRREESRYAPVRAGKAEEAYVATFYPSALDETGASPIDVGMGQELSGMDIRLRKAAVFRVRGKVVDAASGRPLRNVRVMLLRSDRDAGALGMFHAAAAMQDQETFEIANVPPGSYILTAAAFQGQPRLVARQRIEVGNSNVDGVTVLVGPPLEVRGVVRVEGREKADLRTVRVTLMPTDGITFNTPNALPNEDGSFVVRNVARDRYRIEVVNLPEDAYLKSVRLGSRDVLEHGLDLLEGAPGGVLEITLGSSPAQVEGVVQQETQGTASGAIVTLVPDPPRPERNDLYRTANTDQNGRFSIKSIAPGTYRLYAWEELEAGAQADPDLLKQHESRSVKVDLRGNSRESVQLTLVGSDSAASRE